MLKRMLFVSAVFAALTVPGTASAATRSQGVVVKVDRSLVAVASTTGHVRLVHIAGASRFRVGQLISYSARKLRNGTFAGTSVRVVRATRGVQVRGLVLRSTPGGFAVSAHGAVLRFHAVRGMRTTAGVAGAAPRRGSTVLVSATHGKTGLNATRVRVINTSAGAGAFEGNITAVGPGTITVADDGVSLTLAVPSTIDVSGFHVGDEVLVYFSTQSDGTLALTAIGGDETATEADDDAEVEGDVESADDQAQAGEDQAQDNNDQGENTDDQGSTTTSGDDDSSEGGDD
jgi:hypothetical protein